jgi:hypothetical protein
MENWPFRYANPLPDGLGALFLAAREELDEPFEHLGKRIDLSQFCAIDNTPWLAATKNRTAVMPSCFLVTPMDQVAVPAVRTIAQWVWRRRVDWVGVLAVLGFAVSLVASIPPFSWAIALAGGAVHTIGSRAISAHSGDAGYTGTPPCVSGVKARGAPA